MERFNRHTWCHYRSDRSGLIQHFSVSKHGVLTDQDDEVVRLLFNNINRTQASELSMCSVKWISIGTPPAAW